MPNKEEYVEAVEGKRAEGKENKQESHKQQFGEAFAIESVKFIAGFKPAMDEIDRKAVKRGAEMLYRVSASRKHFKN